MAEALGFAASVMSVASLAIQLAETVQKACSFWESIQEAPREVGHLLDELRILHEILIFISRELVNSSSSTFDKAGDELVRNVLKAAKRDINELESLVTQLSSKIGLWNGRAKRKWAQIQFALKSEKIDKMKSYVESAKSTLNLTLSVLHASRNQDQLLRMSGQIELLAANGSTTSVREFVGTSRAYDKTDDSKDGASCSRGKFHDKSGNENLVDAESQCGVGFQSYTKSTWVSINSGLALLSIQSSSTTFVSTKEETDGIGETTYTRKTLVVNFFWGLSSCRRGLRLFMNNPFDSLKLDIIRRRPCDSLIFCLCNMGDANEVERLLQTGEASVFDVDEIGRGLLHLACHHGHSRLVKLLLGKGADIYMRTDSGLTAMDHLETYVDHVEATTIIRSLVQDGDFNPFEYRRMPVTDLGTSFRGLPYESLKYLFSQDRHFGTGERKFDFIVENLHTISHTVKNYEDCVDLLLRTFETMREDPRNRDQWLYKGTLLQRLSSYWMMVSEMHPKDSELKTLSEFKIGRCLALTTDLYKNGGSGTPLDWIAIRDRDMVQPWLDLLAKNNVDVLKYLQYEFEKHPDGIVFQHMSHCCRHITLNFQQEENGITGVKVENICDPKYTHFHPEYRCEARTSRQNCITQMPDLMVDDFGKPQQNFPGSWARKLMPNSESLIVYRWSIRTYVEFMKRGDYIWNEGTKYWTRYWPLDEKFRRAYMIPT